MRNDFGRKFKALCQGRNFRRASRIYEVLYCGSVLELSQRTGKLAQWFVADRGLRTLRNSRLKYGNCLITIVYKYAINPFVSRLITNRINRLNFIQTVIVLQIPN